MSAEILRQDTSSVQAIFAQWNKRRKIGQLVPKKLLYILHYKYSQASLCYDNLKGRDALIVRLLKVACQKEDFALLFGHLEKIVEGIRLDNEDDPYGDAYAEISLTDLTEANGKHFLNAAHMLEEEIIQDEPWEYYDEEVTKETGNQAVDATHTYQNTVSIPA